MNAPHKHHCQVKSANSLARGSRNGSVHGPRILIIISASSTMGNSLLKGAAVTKLLIEQEDKFRHDREQLEFAEKPSGKWSGPAQ